MSNKDQKSSISWKEILEAVNKEIEEKNIASTITAEQKNELIAQKAKELTGYNRIRRTFNVLDEESDIGKDNV